MLNLIYAMKIFGHRSVESFRRELSRNSQLRIACGLSEGKYKYLRERKLEKTSLDTDVSKLKLLKQEFMSQKYSFQDKIVKYFPEEIARLKNKIAAMEEDVIKLNEYTKKI